jgi:hypothetical protein
MVKGSGSPVSIAAAAAVAAFACALPMVAHGAGDAAFVNPTSIQWGDAPPGLPKGAKIALLDGDPGKPGSATVRLKLPANYRIAPHMHSKDEDLTVLSGGLYLGLSDKVEPAKAHALQVGGFHHLPAKTVHYVFTKAPTIVQVHLEGPFDIIYVNPADDPSKAVPKP